MITLEELQRSRERVLALLEQAKIALTPQEYARIEISDLGLGMIATIGLQIVTYVNTGRVCAKEIILFPHQICPEHRHPPVGDDPGKEETFRCRWGEVYLYLPGDPTHHPKAILPKGREGTFSVWREVILRPGEQCTLLPNTLHWFQAGELGAILSEFSTHSRDELDIFTDPEIRRVAET
jgi:D-lyxose ketol-isomerase